MIDTYASRVARHGQEIWGEHWLGPMADLTGIAHRTCKRIRRAAEAGEDFPAARGVLAALEEALEARLVEIRADQAPMP